MKTPKLLFVFVHVLVISSYGQKPVITLTFTADSNSQHVPLNSILIGNLTQGGDTTLYAPDTVLVLDYVTGTGENENAGDDVFSVSQNFPNPMEGKTTVTLFLPENKNVLINVSDIMGRQLIHKEYRLKCGHHSFTFFPGRESIYFLTARMDQQSCTIKMFNTPSLSDLSGNCKLEYGGNPITPEGYKASIALNGFVFSLGNQLKFTAYTALGERTIIDTPAGNMTYTFQYGSGGIPCPGMPTVTWQGVTYHTVLIGDQCWLKENMNWETGISWCYDYDPSNCEIYGRLYNWPTALGVCPTGWHLPSDEEWKEIEGVVDNQYGYPDPEWDQTGWRGYDAGLNLKSTTGWNTGGNGPDPYGFSALPGGTRAGLGLFYGLGHDSAWWTSTENVWSTAWRRYLSYYSEEANRYYYSMYYAFYVRCLRDY